MMQCLNISQSCLIVKFFFFFGGGGGLLMVSMICQFLTSAAHETNVRYSITVRADCYHCRCGPVGNIPISLFL